MVFCGRNLRSPDTGNSISYVEEERKAVDDCCGFVYVSFGGKNTLFFARITHSLVPYRRISAWRKWRGGKLAFLQGLKGRGGGEASMISS